MNSAPTPNGSDLDLPGMRAPAAGGHATRAATGRTCKAEGTRHFVAARTA